MKSGVIVDGVVILESSRQTCGRELRGMGPRGLVSFFLNASFAFGGAADRNMLGGCSSRGTAAGETPPPPP